LDISTALCVNLVNMLASPESQGRNLEPYAELICLPDGQILFTWVCGVGCEVTRFSQTDVEVVVPVFCKSG
jgi:hypothetical protein